MQKLADICIRRPVFATMLILALVVVGSAAYFKLGVDRLPSVDLPTVNVRTTLPGASPEQVERSVESMQPGAIAAAEERARTDLDCGALTSKVLSSDHSQVRDAYSLRRILYRIEVRGCNRKTVFSVACLHASMRAPWSCHSLTSIRLSNVRTYSSSRPWT